MVRIRKRPVGVPPPGLYPPEVTVGQISGLRRQELADLRVRDITQDHEGRVWIHVPEQMRSSAREVPVLEGYQQELLTIVQDARVLKYVPDHGAIDAWRRRYARDLYRQLLGLDRHAHYGYDETAVKEAMKALGHHDQEIVARYYLGLRDFI